VIVDLLGPTGCPLHRHTREGEYSYVVEGRIGALLGDEMLVGAAPGDVTFKRRNQWHTVWNAGDEPARIRRSSPLPASSGSSANSSTSGASPGPSRRPWLTCASRIPNSLAESRIEATLRGA
jgi:hypothetical protein